MVSSLIEVLFWWFWRKINRYPTKCPLVYLCVNNGVTAVVRAEDFDRELLRVRRSRYNRSKLSHAALAWRPVVEMPIFLYSNLGEGNDRRDGNMDDLEMVVKDYAVEYREFYVPAIHSYHEPRYTNSWARNYLRCGDGRRS